MESAVPTVVLAVDGKRGMAANDHGVDGRPCKLARIGDDRVAAMPVGSNYIEIDGKSCTHEVCWPPGAEGSMAPPQPRTGPPAREYPFIIDPFQQTAINALEAGETSTHRHRLHCSCSCQYSEVQLLGESESEASWFLTKAQQIYEPCMFVLQPWSSCCTIQTIPTGLHACPVTLIWYRPQCPGSSSYFCREDCGGRVCFCDGPSVSYKSHVASVE